VYGIRIKHFGVSDPFIINSLQTFVIG
jgi:hypothetical protein